MKPYVALLVLLPLLAGPAQAQQRRMNRWIRNEDLRHRVDAATRLAIAHLRKIQQSDGRWTYHNRPVRNTPGRFPKTAPKPGTRTRPTATTQEKDAGLTALVLWALASSGVRAEDADVRRALEWIDLHPRSYDTTASLGTYSASLLVLALTRLDPVEHGSAIRALADRLVKAQHSTGMWGYSLRPPRANGRTFGPGDHSNTQFAVLALWAAHSLAGHNAPRSTWARIERHFRRTQLPDGSWPYQPPKQGGAIRTPKDNGTATMTVAGLVSSIYATAAADESELVLQRKRGSAQSKAGSRAFSRLLKKPDWYDYYLVASIERMGTVLGLRDLGWYEKGCARLCDVQLEGGIWKDNTKHGDGRHAYATSFALLFLARATLPPRKGVITPPDRIDALTAKERRPMMQTARSHRRAFEIYVTLPRGTREDDAVTLGARGKEFVDLVADTLTKDGRAEARAAAHEVLEALLGKRFLYDAKATAQDRAVMAKPIVETWRGMRKTAVWDSRARHYVAR